ncbi:hypothetical protein Poly30_16380 [Planctomycetes bacterium Poly30]|uniref:Lipid A 3-O-deacylase (PagL) n=2 Tax=Saltatorellus ferox TaxID=2528018 RepID=A0A518EPW4_9BACT|nr:hypothetical protein Poly30_16380 [Planctomycetes bacterium Poly30]
MVACQSPKEQAISVYAGPYTDNSLPEEIGLFKPLSFEDATLVAAAYSQVIEDSSPYYRWEVEGNVVQWFGEQDHQQLGGLALFRWMAFPWDHWVDTSFGFGNGLSWATKTPELEEAFHPDTGSTQLLWHIAIEFEFARPRRAGKPSWMDSWATFVRVHHRSGILGTFDGVDGGSNVLALGLRYRW